jgi:hypothetical protein
LQANFFNGDVWVIDKCFICIGGTVLGQYNYYNSFGIDWQMFSIAVLQNYGLWILPGLVLFLNAQMVCNF